ncbi:MAG: hypothetical protein Q7J34_14345 [Bacteroidales bacterium]|nr:hypothetical protein [Bacteroidales bacterium]
MFYSTVIATPLKEIDIPITKEEEYKPLVRGQGVSIDTKNNNDNLIKEYSLRMIVELTCSYLWKSPHSYQQELFSLICEGHEDDELDFKQVSNWLNEIGYISPRGKVFMENHV